MLLLLLGINTRVELLIHRIDVWLTLLENSRVFQIICKEAEVEQFCEDLQDLLELTPPKKDVLFIIGDWNAKVGSQEISGVTGKFDLGV